MARSPGYFITKIAILVAALHEWKCPACGGSGKYLHRGWKPAPAPAVAEFINETVPCKKCDGAGLHPTAQAALKNAEEVTDD